MSSFSGLNTALSGLIAHKRSIDVIGQNIANVNSPGYTRRSVLLEPSNGQQISSRYDTGFNWNNLGVTVASVNRIRDAFLDVRARSEAAKSASAGQVEGTLSGLEGVFPEPSDTALGGQLAAFWNAFADAANNPTSLPARAAVLAQASTLVSTFAKASASLTGMHADISTQATMTVDQVNTVSKQVADLNAQIRAANVAGMDTGDLEDKRDNLIDQLTSAVGATTRAGDYHQVDVMLGGSPLVSGSHTEKIELAQTGPLAPPLNTLAVQNNRLQWQRDGYPVDAVGGTVGGMLQSLNDIVPRYMSSLDSVASSVVTAVNTLHQGGQGQNATLDVGLNFFDPAGVTASTMAISTDVAGQPSRIALGSLGSGGLDGTVGHALAAIGDSLTGPGALYRSMIGRLGVEAGAASDRADLQARFATEADNERINTSGVNLDEEMTNLVMSQRAYESSARLLTTVDSMLDTLINRTGVTR
ncbi:MAG: flagellar hook-associated protein FlgK [Acidimicrobiales bacterium]